MAKIELEAFRSKNGDIIILDELYETKPKLFISPTVSQARVTVKYRYLTAEKPYNPFTKDTLTMVFNGKDDDEETMKHTCILYDQKMYNRIECPNQIKEMLAGIDPDASVLAYDLLSYHSQELAGFIKI